MARASRAGANRAMGRSLQLLTEPAPELILGGQEVSQVAVQTGGFRDYGAAAQGAVDHRAHGQVDLLFVPQRYACLLYAGVGLDDIDLIRVRRRVGLALAQVLPEGQAG